MHKFAEKIMECVKSKVEARGIDNVSYEEAKELGEWVDIAKDIVCYDKDMRLIEAMDEEEKYGDMDYRMGYRGRNSRGRFVHGSGRGRSAGYTPFIPPFMMGEGYEDEYEYPEMYGDYRMGYSGGRGRNSGGSRSGDPGGNYSGPGSSGNIRGQGENSGGSRYGESYDGYRNARRHYTESGDEQSKKRMQESVSEVFDDMEDIVNDVMKSMDANEKAKYRQKLTQMVQKMQ